MDPAVFNAAPVPQNITWTGRRRKATGAERKRQIDQLQRD
jgi:hypothetical protein